MNFYKDYGCFVEPKEVRIENKIFGYFVPFKQKLENLLSIIKFNEKKTKLI